MTVNLNNIVDDILSEQQGIALGADHGGFPLKEELKPFLEKLGFRFMDLGTFSSASVNYPNFALKVAQAVQSGHSRFGIMIDGAGIGSAIVCNKVKGIRAAHCANTFEAYNARAHNNCNILTLGARVIGIELIKRIVDTFLKTPFEGGRHQERVAMITEWENAAWKS
ncbi:MAG: ribose 5-phosphate isomerase B [Acidobacteria bacterium]|nr:ribose 5-phosphate isomerase B [Acidobacteriota bacterium]